MFAMKSLRTRLAHWWKRNTTVFLLNGARRDDPRLIGMSLLYAVLRVPFAFLIFYFPKSILESLMQEGGRVDLAMLIAMMSALALTALLTELIHNLAYADTIRLRFMFAERHQLRCLEQDFQTTEDPEYEKRLYAAVRCLNTNSTGIEGSLHRLFDWPYYLISLAVYLYTIASQSAMLLILLALSSLASSLILSKLDARRRPLDLSWRDRGRRFRFFSRWLSDHKSAKDVRFRRARPFCSNAFMPSETTSLPSTRPVTASNTGARCP